MTAATDGLLPFLFRTRSRRLVPRDIETADPVERRRRPWHSILLLVLFVQVIGGPVIAAAAVQIKQAADCRRNDLLVATGYPFVDRLGDARFAPQPLAPSSKISTVVQPRLGSLPVSAAAVDDETLLLVNYHDIRSLNVGSGEVVRLAADLSRLANPKFVPTGVAVGPRSRMVYLANYLANNILIGRLDIDKIVFEKQLTGDGLISPENLALSPDERWLISANYDGNSATAFEAKDGAFVQKWSAAVPLAHGVAILGDRVFVSSLLQRQVVVLSLEDGAVLGSFGAPGWQAYCLNFLWPTGVQTVNDDMLVVTDSHTGGIYRIVFGEGSATLLDVVGGTAPGAFGLQMPYATAPIGNSLAILSTFSPKVVIAGPAAAPDAPKIEKLIVQQAEQAEVDAESSEAPPLGVGWNGYVHFAAPPLRISGIGMVPSYGALISVTRDRPTAIEQTYALNPDTLSLFGASMYFIEAHPLRGGVVLSSPSAPFVLYVTLGETSCLAKVDLPAAPLATDRGLQHRHGTSRYEDMERRARARLRELDLRRGSHDVADLADIAGSLGTTTAAASAAIRTAAVKEVVAGLDKCGPDQSANADCEEAVTQASGKARAATSLIELLFLDMSVHKCIL